MAILLVMEGQVKGDSGKVVQEREGRGRQQYKPQLNMCHREQNCMVFH